MRLFELACRASQLLAGFAMSGHGPASAGRGPEGIAKNCNAEDYQERIHWLSVSAMAAKRKSGSSQARAALSGLVVGDSGPSFATQEHQAQAGEEEAERRQRRIR